MDGHESDLMVKGAIRITDKFELDQDKKEKGEEDDKRGTGSKNRWLHHASSSSASFDEEMWADFNGDNVGGGGGDGDSGCPNTLALWLGAAAFLLAQCALAGAWLWLYHRTRRRNGASAGGGGSLALPPSEEDEELPPPLKDFDPYFGEGLFLGSRHHHQRRRRRRRRATGYPGRSVRYEDEEGEDDFSSLDSVSREPRSM